MRFLSQQTAGLGLRSKWHQESATVLKWSQFPNNLHRSGQFHKLRNQVVRILPEILTPARAVPTRAPILGTVPS